MHRPACVGSATVGPEPMVWGSSPGTSEMASVSMRARARCLAQAAALDARQVPAHRVHLMNVGAAFEKTARQRRLGGEIEAGRRRRPKRRSSARQEHENQIAEARPTAARSRARSAASWLAASGVGWRASSRSKPFVVATVERSLHSHAERVDQSFDASAACRASGSAPRHATAIAAAALPTARTIRRPPSGKRGQMLRQDMWRDAPPKRRHHTSAFRRLRAVPVMAPSITLVVRSAECRTSTGCRAASAARR